MSTTNVTPSLWVGAALAGATTVATIVIGYRVIQNWQSSASTTDMSSRSTTSSAGGGPEAYETKKAVDEYLQFHFPVGEELMPYDKGPKDAVHFTQNCALLCERHCPALQDFSGDEQDVGTTALDIGCAVGGAAFELARSFQHVMGIDYSREFIKAAETMKAEGRMPYEAVVEGTLTESYMASVDEGIDRDKVRFMVGDACNLRPDLREVDCVLAANLLCRLPDPIKFLDRLPSLVKKGGIAVLVSPYSWLPGWTPKDKWLGGFAGPGGQPVRSKEALRAVMEERGFVLAHEEDMPFLIREHARKFQWGCSHATVWAKQ